MSLGILEGKIQAILFVQGVPGSAHVPGIRVRDQCDLACGAKEEMSFDPCLGRHRPGSWCVVRHGPRYFDLGQLGPAVGAQARWGGPSTKGVVSFCASCRWLRPQGR